MAMFISNSVSDTEDLAEDWGRSISRGVVLGLSGELGAGKTQLVRGFARGLGSLARVHSPTFAIVNTYEGGRLPLAHLDLYRLETPQALIGAGVEEFLQPKGVAIIEWAERLFLAGPDGTSPLISESRLPDNLRRVTIEVVNETTRRIQYDDLGA